eukprot:5131011-Amphidinium_carterae.1
MWCKPAEGRSSCQVTLRGVSEDRWQASELGFEARQQEPRTEEQGKWQALRQVQTPEDGTANPATSTTWATGQSALPASRSKLERKIRQVCRQKPETSLQQHGA